MFCDGFLCICWCVLFFLPFFALHILYKNRIFGRTLSLILENIENYLLGCYDVVGLLIMIKVRTVRHAGWLSHSILAQARL